MKVDLSHNGFDISFYNDKYNENLIIFSVTKIDGSDSLIGNMRDRIRNVFDRVLPEMPQRAFCQIESEHYFSGDNFRHSINRVGKTFKAADCISIYFCGS